MFSLTLDGRVGKNGAEIKTSKGGKQYLKFSLANNSYSGGQNKTTWFDVICYKPEIINGIGNYLKKGSFVYVHTNVIEDVTRTKRFGLIVLSPLTGLNFRKWENGMMTMHLPKFQLTRQLRNSKSTRLQQTCLK